MKVGQSTSSRLEDLFHIAISDKWYYYLDPVYITIVDSTDVIYK